MIERFKKLGYEAGSENNHYYVVALDDEGWYYSNTLKTFNSIDDMLDYLYYLEDMKEQQ